MARCMKMSLYGIAVAKYSVKLLFTLSNNKYFVSMD